MVRRRIPQITVVLLIALATPTPASASDVQVDESATSDVLCDAGHQALERELYDQASELFARALAVNPSDSCSLVGIQMMESAQSQAAAKALKGEVESLCASANAALAVGQRATAEEKFLAALENDPGADCGSSGLESMQTWEQVAQGWVERNLRLTWSDLPWIFAALLIVPLVVRWLYDKASLMLRGPRRWFQAGVRPRLGIITLSVANDESGGLDGRIRTELGQFGLQAPSPAGGTSTEIATAVTEAAPTGTAIVTAFPKLWVQLKPGRLHRVVVSVLTRDSEPMHGVVVEIAGRRAKSHLSETVWAATLDDAGDQASWIVFDHVLTGHRRTQWGVRKHRRWTKPGSFRLFRSAIFALDSGKSEEAAKSLSQAAQAEPDNTDVSLWRSRAQVHARNYEDALIVLLDTWHLQSGLPIKAGESARPHVAVVQEMAGVLSYASDWSAWADLWPRLTRYRKDHLSEFQPQGVALPPQDASARQVTEYGLKVSAAIYRILSNRLGDGSCTGAEYIVALQQFNVGLALSHCGIPVGRPDTLEPIMLEATGEGLEGRWNRALFYSRALEAPQATSEQLDAWTQRAFTELEYAIADSAWSETQSNWLYVDPDLQPLRSHDNGATWRDWQARPRSPYADPPPPPPYPDRISTAVGDSATAWNDVMASIKEATGSYPTSLTDLEVACQLTIAMVRAAALDASLKTHMTSIAGATGASVADDVASRYREEIRALAGTLGIVTQHPH